MPSKTSDLGSFAAIELVSGFELGVFKAHRPLRGFFSDRLGFPGRTAGRKKTAFGWQGVIAIL